MTALVACRDIVCRLGGRTVLDGAALRMDQGESLGLLGRSGSGKTTLLRVIAGLEVPDRGEVVLSGETATRDGRLAAPPHRRGVAMLFQDLALWPNLSAAGNVRLGLAGTKLSSAERAERTREALAMCGIDELAARRPGTLSGGQQQRVALARALAVRPQLLLLDEPFGGLDLPTKDVIVKEIIRLRTRLGFGLILVTHDPSEIRLLCGRLAVLEQGRIAEHGPLADAADWARTDLAQAVLRHGSPPHDV